MTQIDILDRLQGIMNDVFVDEVVVSPQLAAKDVSEWDSLRQISLVLAVEHAFGIRFNVGEVDDTDNVGDFAELIRRKVNRAS